MPPRGCGVVEALEHLNLTWEARDGIRAHTWRIEPPPVTRKANVCATPTGSPTCPTMRWTPSAPGVRGETSRPRPAVFGEPAARWWAG